MAAYVVVEIEIHDPVTYEEYKRLAPPSIEKYGGRYIVRGGAIETLEGDWKPERFVMLEFPSVEQAKKWWNCAEYAQAKALRQKSSKTQMIVAGGL
jgi:uncharacterized protein (DUF1330 family)